MVGTHGRTDKRWRMLALARAARRAYGRKPDGTMCLRVKPSKNVTGAIHVAPFDM
jgi:hypothetical protein